MNKYVHTNSRKITILWDIDYRKSCLIHGPLRASGLWLIGLDIHLCSDVFQLCEVGCCPFVKIAVVMLCSSYLLSWNKLFQTIIIKTYQQQPPCLLFKNLEHGLAWTSYLSLVPSSCNGSKAGHVWKAGGCSLSHSYVWPQSSSRPQLGHLHWGYLRGCLASSQHWG